MATPPPGSFRILCKAFPKASAKSETGDCTPIIFSNGPSGGAFDRWEYAPLQTGGYGFRNVGSGSWATAYDNVVVGCSTPDPEGRSAWTTIRNPDGTFIVSVPDPNLKTIWKVDSQGQLVLTSAQSQLTDDKIFAFV